MIVEKCTSKTYNRIYQFKPKLLELISATFVKKQKNKAKAWWQSQFGRFTLAAESLPSVRENTGSAELRMSSDEQFAMIWNHREREEGLGQRKDSAAISSSQHAGGVAGRYLGEVGVLGSRQEACKQRGAIEAHHRGHHQVADVPTLRTDGHETQPVTRFKSSRALQRWSF